MIDMVWQGFNLCFPGPKGWTIVQCLLNNEVCSCSASVCNYDWWIWKEKQEKTDSIVSSCPLRKAWCPEAPLVRGRACSSRGALDPKHHRASCPRQGWLWALPAAVPLIGQQPSWLASHQVLLPQPHPAVEEKSAAWKWAAAPHCLLREEAVEGGERGVGVGRA